MSWRDTLFIWRGRFRRRDTTYPGEDDPSFDWQGTWIGVDAGGTLKPDAPEMEAFAEKGLPKFDVRGSLDPDRTDRTEGFSGEYRSDPDRGGVPGYQGWQLDQGDGKGLTWFDDDEHRIRVDGDDVFAVGRNKFGPFVSAGVASGYSFQKFAMGPEGLSSAPSTESSSRVVVLARRYLDEKDARATMRLDEWAAEAKRDRKNGVKPWNVPAMASEKKRASHATPATKKRRTAERP
jgi:hypothetical protein